MPIDAIVGQQFKAVQASKAGETQHIKVLRGAFRKRDINRMLIISKITSTNAMLRVGQ